MNTIRALLATAYQRLKHSDTARLDAQLLLSHVLNVEKAYLIAYDDRVLTAEELAQFEALLARREKGEPIAYILGKRGFYDLEFVVTPDVLIPRPETEHLIVAALAFAQNKSDIIAADIGTGSGAIAVTFAKHAPQASVHAVDLSSLALKVAQENARLNNVNIQFHEGHLAQPLISAGIKVNLLMANLPYIRTATMKTLAVSQHEPHLALDGGADGLDLVCELLLQVPNVCHDEALILLEIGAEQGQAMLDFADEHLKIKTASIIKDYAGHDRIISLQV